MEWKWFVGGIILVAVAAFFILNHGTSEQPQPTSREIVAIAGGQAIYSDDVTNEISRMALIGTGISRQDALNVLITRSVLASEAAKQGVIVKGNETEQEFSRFIAGRNLTRAQFERMLAQKNLTLGYFMSVLNAELTVKKLVEAQLPLQFIIKYNDVLKLYNERYNNTNITFDQMEKNLTDELTKVRQEEYKQDYIKKILSKAEVISFS
ncbi:MAG: SurA N-terminal domain-containing protein [Candidatus Woesearchaeota archaeon]